MKPLFSWVCIRPECRRNDHDPSYDGICEVHPKRRVWFGQPAQRGCARPGCDAAEAKLAGPEPDRGRKVMLTKDILFGMNIVTLAGFVVAGLTLTLNRMGRRVRP
jgi:hypothetical protein